MAEEKRRYLDTINSPADLKRLRVEELEAVCAELREYILECCAVNPGHLGSSLGAVELAVALHYVYDTPSDRLVWDVGHQAYAHKILTAKEVKSLGWDYIDVIIFTGDAYIDHPSFGTAVIARWLQKHGYRVA